VGEVVGRVAGLEFSAIVGTSVPIGIGGVAALAAVSLVIGTQLIRRRKK
jgi:hypothetical protein